MKASITLDLGGTRIKAGIVQDGRVLQTALIESRSDQGLVARIPVLVEHIDRMLMDLQLKKEQLGGVGISIPGIVDTGQMKLLSVNKKFSDAVNFDFKSWAKSTWNLPLVMENDARSALVGEWQYGAGRGSDNLVMVTLGTGIGGAAVIEGNLVRGKHFQAGCLAGHFTVNYHGAPCNCGNIGCVESEASTWRLPELARKHPDFRESGLSSCAVIDYKALFEQEAKGDTVAAELLNLSLDVWGAGVINLIHAYDPEIVVMGGGIMKMHEKILGKIREKVNNHAWTPWGKVDVRVAHYPDTAALLGTDYLLNKYITEKSIMI